MVSASLLTMWLPNISKLQNRSSACKNAPTIANVNKYAPFGESLPGWATGDGSREKSAARIAWSWHALDTEEICSCKGRPLPLQMLHARSLESEHRLAEVIGQVIRAA